MKFYLGTHKVIWLAEFTVPLMVNRRRFLVRRSYPRAACEWFLDSGAFSELGLFGGWAVSEDEFVDEVRSIGLRVGRLEWAAPQDWPCEPAMLAKTGLSVVEHQERTVANYLRLLSLAPDVPWLPVLQGWTLPDYARCVDMYGEAGVDLAALPLVGLGTVCRRQASSEVEEIIRSLAGLRLHGFGVKGDGLRRYGDLLASADSMAWSYAGRRRGPCANSCQNHRHYALEWRARALAERPLQLHLEGA